MSESPTAVVRELFERVNAGDVESVLELIAPDFVLVVPPEASAEPDTYEGHEGIRRYFDGFQGVLDQLRFELVELEEVSPDAVLAQIRLSGRGASGGIPVAQTATGALTVRDGLVREIAIHTERASALARIRGELR